MRLTERRKMEVNENRGRLGGKKLQGKIRKKKNHQKEKDITGSVKSANHNNHSSRFARCVWSPVSFMGQADTLCIHFPLPAKETAKKEKSFENP